jgi:hypothetical protein
MDVRQATLKAVSFYLLQDFSNPEPMQKVIP